MFVRHHDDGSPRTRWRRMNFRDQVHDFLAGFTVEISRRLVRQQDHGPIDERARNGCALLFASRKLRGAVLHAGREANAIERFMHARAARSPRGTSANRSGSSTFSSSVIRGKSWKDWKTIPIVWLRWLASSSLDIAARSRPCARIAPEDGRSSPAIKLSSVDLPDPLAPNSARNSPARTSSEIWSTARISASPIL